jgi:serine/threonine-protein kinase
MPNLPQKLGRYPIVGELAVGGMAEILLARVVGPSGFERPVVIKRILPHLARQPSFVSMFLDEARIAAAIRHQNVVHVQELVREADELFLVMEYLEGESVAGLMRRLVARHETLDRSIATHIVAEACAGLQAAHVLTDEDGTPRNLVHRDVSPQNLFVSYDGQVKVLDFGIAHAVGRSTRTETGQIKGKFEYMSPEQVRGEPLDRRSDIFALGIVLYELSTLRRLFKRPSPAEVIQAVNEGAVVPPSRLVADYPPSLEAICMRALAPSPDGRYPTAADMRRDLLTAMRDLPQTEPPGDALARLMESVFADRVAEKREVLRRVRSGSDVSHVPAGEADEAVDMPGIPDEPTTTAGPPTTTDTPPAARRLPARPARRLVAVAPLALIAVALVTGLVRTVSWGRGAQAVPPAAATSASTSAAPMTMPPPAPTDVLVHIDTQPPGATVVVDGSERGVTPVELRIARGDQAVGLELRRAGFVTVKQSLVPDADQRVLLDLQPRTPDRRPAGPSRPPSAPAAPSSSANPWAKWN